MKFGFYAALLVFIACSDKDKDKEEPKETGSPELGAFYQGGVVFYLNEAKTHGLICAVKDLSFPAVWCDDTGEISGADGTSIGTGMQNSLDIVAGCSGGSAARQCLDLTSGGFDDWFLPSLDELNEMYQRREVINATAASNGGAAFAEDTYWSSTEMFTESPTSARTVDFGFGATGNLTKFGTARVRPIREF